MIHGEAIDFLSERQQALCHYAQLLTKEPHVHETQDQTRQLRGVGIGDSGILDATLVVAYFNFVNRIVLSLGVELEDDQGQGYRY